MPLPWPRSHDDGPAVRAIRVWVLLAAGFGALGTGGAAHAAPNAVTVSDPWMRTVMPSRPAAGYFTVANATATAHRLVGAESPACGMLMLHQSVHENGQERMVMVKSVVVPAHASVTFAPGGYHLMCMSPTPAVAPGHAVPVTLRFADGDKVTASFPVRGATGK
jgi:hypothetical protein